MLNLLTMEPGIIKELDKETVNRIAAGEIISRSIFDFLRRPIFSKFPLVSDP